MRDIVLMSAPSRRIALKPPPLAVVVYCVRYTESLPVHRFIQCICNNRIHGVYDMGIPVKIFLNRLDCRLLQRPVGLTKDTLPVTS